MVWVALKNEHVVAGIKRCRRKKIPALRDNPRSCPGSHQYLMAGTITCVKTGGFLRLIVHFKFFREKSQEHVRPALKMFK